MDILKEKEIEIRHFNYKGQLIELHCYTNNLHAKSFTIALLKVLSILQKEPTFSILHNHSKHSR